MNIVGCVAFIKLTVVHIHTSNNTGTTNENIVPSTGTTLFLINKFAAKVQCYNGWVFGYRISNFEFVLDCMYSQDG